MESGRDKEIEDIRAAVTEDIIKTLTRDVCIIRIYRSRIKSITLTFGYPENYPSSACFVEVKSRTLPDGLIKKLNTQCEKVATDLAKEAKLQVVEIYESMKKLFDQNQLLSCFREINRIKKMLVPEDGDELRANEKSGKITVKLQKGAYFYKFAMQVPDQYPDDMYTYRTIESNFPNQLLKLFLAHADEVLRRLSMGQSYTFVVNSSVNTNVKTKKIDQELEVGVMTREQYKHEVDFLKIGGDLKGYSHDKSMRRQRVRLLKKETAVEKEKLAKLLEEEEESFVEPQPCLVEFCDYLITRLVKPMPDEFCQECNKILLPEDPAELDKILAKQEESKKGSKKKQKKEDKHPERVFCGHWFHYCCLEEFVHRPPFGKKCPKPGCDQVVTHPLFPTDPKTLKAMEHSWALDQAKKRELEEIADLMGL